MACSVPGRPAEIGTAVPGKMTVSRRGRTGSIVFSLMYVSPFKSVAAGCVPAAGWPLDFAFPCQAPYPEIRGFVRRLTLGIIYT